MNRLMNGLSEKTSVLPTIVAKPYHSTGGAQGCAGRARCAAKYAVARKSYSRSRIVAGPDGLVLATRETGFKWSPHQSTTPARKLYDVAPQKAGYKLIGLPENCSSWDE